MNRNPEMDDEEEGPVGVHSRPRRSGPRFGPLLTIAVAILTLFGAVSRLGKPQPLGDGLLATLDLSAKASLEGDRLRSEEERLRTIVSIGAVASASDAPRHSPPAARLDAHALPPPRGDFDLEEYLRGGDSARPVSGGAAPARSPARVTLSIAGEAPGNSDHPPRFDPAPEAVPDAVTKVPQTYTVQPGDTWVKVAEKTGKRWQDVRKANPSSASGLRVGMKLVIP